jgi:hypothetical protein
MAVVAYSQGDLVVFLEPAATTSLYKRLIIDCSMWPYCTTELHSLSGAITRSLTAYYLAYTQSLSSRYGPSGLQLTRQDTLRQVNDGSSVRFEHAIKGYPTILVARLCTDCETGVSRNRPGSVAISSKAEATYLAHILESCAARHGFSVNEFVE